MYLNIKGACSWASLLTMFQSDSVILFQQFVLFNNVDPTFDWYSTFSSWYILSIIATQGANSPQLFNTLQYLLVNQQRLLTFVNLVFQLFVGFRRICLEMWSWPSALEVLGLDLLPRCYFCFKKGQDSVLKTCLLRIVLVGRRTEWFRWPALDARPSAQELDDVMVVEVGCNASSSQVTFCHLSVMDPQLSWVCV